MNDLEPADIRGDHRVETVVEVLVNDDDFETGRVAQCGEALETVTQIPVVRHRCDDERNKERLLHHRYPIKSYLVAKREGRRAR